MSSIKFSAGRGRWPVKDGTFTADITVEREGKTQADQVSFSVPDDFHAHPDCVAAALSTLAGRKFGRLVFDFAISRQAQEMIASTYDADVAFDGVPPPPRQPGSNIALNFSGGFDSLAAKLLAGDDIKLISMAFGGAFAREETYFQTFDTIVCRSDLRAKGYHRNDWRFMGSASLLLADYLELGVIAFGTIFEASPWNYRPPRAAMSRPNGPFGAAGTANTSWVAGLTELGTAMIMLTYQPDAIAPALTSLAMPGSEKYFRKQLLLKLAARRLKLKDDFAGELKLPKEKYQFGSGFTTDFLLPLILQHYGMDFMSQAIAGVPDDPLLKEAMRSDLSFYFKLNPNLLNDIPVPMRPLILQRGYAAGIEPFNETDFASYRKVRTLLERYHKFPV